MKSILIIPTFFLFLILTVSFGIILIDFSTIETQVEKNTIVFEISPPVYNLTKKNTNLDIFFTIDLQIQELGIIPKDITLYFIFSYKDIHLGNISLFSDLFKTNALNISYSVQLGKNISKLLSSGETLSISINGLASISLLGINHPSLISLTQRNVFIGISSDSSGQGSTPDIPRI